MAVYTTIDDPSAHFQTALYAGNNTTDHNITNDGNSDLQPDLVWIKQRTSDNPHVLQDTSRGFNGSGLAFNLQTNSTAVEGTNGAFESFNTNGFGVGGTNVASGAYNLSGSNYVAWQWKANGGTTASNTTGSVTSTVQVNSDAGFSIVTFDSASSGNFSVGHGLGVQPAMIITKNREGTGQWYTWHKDLTGGTSNTSYLLSLNRTDAEESFANAWGAGVTSSVFGMQSGNTATASNDYIAYCFAEKQGYSKFGSYVGNSNDNGTFVYLGFKPRWLMIKSITETGMPWNIIDTARSTSNVMDDYLTANTTDPQGTSSTKNIDFLSNGFKCRDDNNLNFSDHTYIYMAFAENPFVTSTGTPTTAR